MRTPEAGRHTLKLLIRARWRFAAPLVLTLCLPTALSGYSVLSHEALIDTVWNPFIVPLLLSRFPGSTPKQLQEAHAYAYGGCVIQDMGYYPFGNRLFSNLTHYVRGADFIKAMLKDARSVNEYAFALGALSHYAADNTGHPLAVNLSVADLYPKLEKRYGRRVTYEDDPRAHMMVEFSFDVVQIAGDGYLPRSYHNYIGFKVSKRLLQGAFGQVYGLKFHKLFFSEGISIWVYQLGASEVIPALTQAAWKQKRKKILKLHPSLVNRKYAYRVSRGNYNEQVYARGRRPRFFFRRWVRRWKAGAEAEQLGLLARLIVVAVEIAPKIGPLRTLNFKPPTPHTQALFIGSFGLTVDRYRRLLKEVAAGQLSIGNRNFDTGKPIHVGDYRLADQSYAQLLTRLAARHYKTVTPELRRNILAFYGDWSIPGGAVGAPGSEPASRARRKLLSELAALRKVTSDE